MKLGGVNAFLTGVGQRDRVSRAARLHRSDHGASPSPVAISGGALSFRYNPLPTAEQARSFDAPFAFASLSDAGLRSAARSLNFAQNARSIFRISLIIR